MNKSYLVVVEETQTGYSAYAPDVPGCIAAGSSRDEVEQNIREAIEFHLDVLQKEGQPTPEPHSYSSYVRISA